MTRQVTLGISVLLSYDVAVFQWLTSYYDHTCINSFAGIRKVIDDVHNNIVNMSTLMLRLHWTTFSLRPYHVLKIQERGEDGVKLKKIRISKFPLRPYYVPATSLLRPHHVLTTPFTFPLRPQYALTKFIPFPLRPCYVLTKTKQFIPRAKYVSIPARSKCKYINQSCIKSQVSCETA